MNQAMRWDLFGIQCNNDVPDANGVRWTVEKVTGWASPKLISDRGTATGRAGGVLLEEKHGERVLEVTGKAYAPTQDAAEDARALLTLMPAVGSTGVVVRYEPVPKSLTVRQGEEPRDTAPVRGVFEYMLTLVSLDPYKRGGDPIVVGIDPGDTVDLDNDGTAPAFLTVEATGSGTVQVRQNDSGQVLRSKASVSSGTTFNGTTKRVTSSGGAVLLGVVGNPSEWLSIPRLATTPVTNQGTAPVEVTYYHAYA